MITASASILRRELAVQRHPGHPASLATSSIDVRCIPTRQNTSRARVEQLDLGGIIDGRVVGRRSAPVSAGAAAMSRSVPIPRSPGSGLQRLALLGAVQAFQTMLPKLCDRYHHLVDVSMLQRS